MDRIAAMRAFAAVAERGSFVAAARALGISRAMASRHVQDLEAHLGARLLDRTTRRVSPTEAGRVYHERCVAILAELAEAEGAIGALQARPSGRLRVNAPVSFGTLHLAEAIAAYMAAHPQVSIELALNDRMVDLVEEGYDLAIRIGRLAPSSLVARRLAPCRLVACAAQRRQRLQHRVEELEGRGCLAHVVGVQGRQKGLHRLGKQLERRDDDRRVAAAAAFGRLLLLLLLLLIAVVSRRQESAAAVRPAVGGGGAQDAVRGRARTRQPDAQAAARSSRGQDERADASGERARGRRKRASRRGRARLERLREARGRQGQHLGREQVRELRERAPARG